MKLESIIKLALLLDVGSPSPAPIRPDTRMSREIHSTHHLGDSAEFAAANLSVTLWRWQGGGDNRPSRDRKKQVYRSFPTGISKRSIETFISEIGRCPDAVLERGENIKLAVRLDHKEPTLDDVIL